MWRRLLICCAGFHSSASACSAASACCACVCVYAAYVRVHHVRAMRAHRTQAYACINACQRISLHLFISRCMYLFICSFVYLFIMFIYLFIYLLSHLLISVSYVCLFIAFVTPTRTLLTFELGCYNGALTLTMRNHVHMHAHSHTRATHTQACAAGTGTRVHVRACGKMRVSGACLCSMLTAYGACAWGDLGKVPHDAYARYLRGTSRSGMRSVCGTLYTP
jgi:hypothetical protein